MVDTRFLIGTWRVESFTVRGEKTETPDGWAEFSFFDDGVVSYAVTRQGKHIEDGVKRHCG